MNHFLTNVCTKFVSVFTIIAFLLSSVTPAQAQSVLNLPPPGSMVHTTSSFVPAIIKGVTIDTQNPFHLNFIVGTGDTGLDVATIEPEAEKLAKYFLAALTVPEDQKWVNLSPYEENRIIPDALATTDMGRDMLAQDYMLKQLTASMMHPEDELGKKFWERVYTKARQMYGATDIPMNTFNKIWIVPSKATVYEYENSAFVVERHLKVYLEKDYVALQKSLGVESFGLDGIAEEDADAVNAAASDVVREVLIPEIEREVNEGQIFANLRQIYNAMILATWYRRALKESLLTQIYANQNKTAGIENNDPDVKNKIYQQYLEAFKVGAYDLLKEDYDPATNETVVRKYFSGGAVYDGKNVRIVPQGKPGDVAQAMLVVDPGEAFNVEALFRHPAGVSNAMMNPLEALKTKLKNYTMKKLKVFKAELEETATLLAPSWNTLLIKREIKEVKKEIKSRIEKKKNKNLAMLDINQAKAGVEVFLSQLKGVVPPKIILNGKDRAAAGEFRFKSYSVAIAPQPAYMRIVFSNVTGPISTLAERLKEGIILADGQPLNFKLVSDGDVNPETKEASIQVVIDSAMLDGEGQISVLQAIRNTTLLGLIFTPQEYDHILLSPGAVDSILKESEGIVVDPLAAVAVREIARIYQDMKKAEDSNIERLRKIQKFSRVLHNKDLKAAAEKRVLRSLVGNFRTWDYQPKEGAVEWKWIGWQGDDVVSQKIAENFITSFLNDFKGKLPEGLSLSLISDSVEKAGIHLSANQGVSQESLEEVGYALESWIQARYQASIENLKNKPVLASYQGLSGNPNPVSPDFLEEVMEAVQTLLKKGPDSGQDNALATALQEKFSISADDIIQTAADLYGDTDEPVRFFLHDLTSEEALSIKFSHSRLTASESLHDILMGHNSKWAAVFLASKVVKLAVARNLIENGQDPETAFVKAEKASRFFETSAIEERIPNADITTNKMRDFLNNITKGQPVFLMNPNGKPDVVDLNPSVFEDVMDRVIKVRGFDLADGQSIEGKVSSLAHISDYTWKVERSDVFGFTAKITLTDRFGAYSFYMNRGGRFSEQQITYTPKGEVARVFSVSEPTRASAAKMVSAKIQRARDEVAKALAKTLKEEAGNNQAMLEGGRTTQLPAIDILTRSLWEIRQESAHINYAVKAGADPEILITGANSQTIGPITRALVRKIYKKSQSRWRVSAVPSPDKFGQYSIVLEFWSLPDGQALDVRNIEKFIKDFYPQLEDLKFDISPAIIRQEPDYRDSLTINFSNPSKSPGATRIQGHHHKIIKEAVAAYAKENLIGEEATVAFEAPHGVANDFYSPPVAFSSFQNQHPVAMSNRLEALEDFQSYLAIPRILSEIRGRSLLVSPKYAPGGEELLEKFIIFYNQVSSSYKIEATYSDTTIHGLRFIQSQSHVVDLVALARVLDDWLKMEKDGIMAAAEEKPYGVSTQAQDGSFYTAIHDPWADKTLVKYHTKEDRFSERPENHTTLPGRNAVPDISGKSVTAVRELLSFVQDIDEVILKAEENRLQDILQSLLGENARWFEDRIRSFDQEIDPARRGAIEKEITAKIDELNAYSDADPDDLEPMLVLKTIEDFRVQGVYSEYAATSADMHLQGLYIAQLIFAGNASRLQMGAMYPIDIWNIAERIQSGDISDKDLQDFGIKAEQIESFKKEIYAFDLQELAKFRFGMGPRQILAYKLFLKKLALENGVNLKEVLEKQTIILHTNDENHQIVLDDLEKNNFYGFNPEKIYLVRQPAFHGFVIENGVAEVDKGSERWVFGHGYNLMQLNQEGQTVQIAEGTEVEVQEKVLSFLPEGAVVGSHRINDQTKWLSEEVASVDKLAYSLYQFDQGYNMTVELVGNPALQKGGQPMLDTTTGKAALIETLAIRGKPALDDKSTEAAKKGAPYNAFRLIYPVETLKDLLKNNLRFYLSFKKYKKGGAEKARLILDSVTGDITQMPNANANFYLKDQKELIHDFKQVSNLPDALEFLIKQDQELSENLDILEGISDNAQMNNKQERLVGSLQQALQGKIPGAEISADYKQISIRVPEDKGSQALGIAVNVVNEQPPGQGYDISLKGDKIIINKAQLVSVPLTSKDFEVKLENGTNGWRALLEKAYNLKNVGRMAWAIAKVAIEEKKRFNLKSGEKLRFIVGYDARPGSREFARRVIDVLAFFVSDIEVAFADQILTTPALTAMTKGEDAYHLGLHVTASHNAPTYNGLKFAKSGVIAPDVLTDMFFEYANNSGNYETEEAVGYLMDQDADVESFDVVEKMNKQYAQDFPPATLKRIKRHFQSQGLDLIVDAMHGSTQPFLHWLEKAGARVVRANPMSDKNYPETVTYLDANGNEKTEDYRPEPLEHFLSPKDFNDFKSQSKDGSVYMALDGDGDRMRAWIKQNGQVVEIRPNALGVLFNWNILDKGLAMDAPYILRTAPTSIAIDKVVEYFRDVKSLDPNISEELRQYYKSLKLVKTVVGSKHFGKYLEDGSKTKAASGFEQSGHQTNLGRFDDAVDEGLKFLQIMAESGKHPADFLQEIYGIVEYNFLDREGAVVVPPEKVSGILESFSQPRAFADRLAGSLGKSVADIEVVIKYPGEAAEIVDIETFKTQDLQDLQVRNEGVTIWFTDGSVSTIRKSGTEPKFRVYAEGLPEEVDNMMTQAAAVLSDSAALVESSYYGEDEDSIDNAQMAKDKTEGVDDKQQKKKRPDQEIGDGKKVKLNDSTWAAIDAHAETVAKQKKQEQYWGTTGKKPNKAQLAVLKRNDPNIKSTNPALEATNVPPPVFKSVSGDGDNLSEFPTPLEVTKTSVVPRNAAVGKTGKTEADAAMNATRSEEQLMHGGINLNDAMLDLQIKRDGKGMILPVSDQPIEALRQSIPGFKPVIINIYPVNNIAAHLRAMAETGGSGDSAAGDVPSDDTLSMGPIDRKFG